DRGLQRVSERELGDRLADDGDERPAALELDRLPVRPLARAQGVCRPCRERCQRVEQLVGRNERLFEPELKGAQRRLAEKQDPGARRDREARARRKGFHDVALVLPFVPERTGDVRPQVIAEPPHDCTLGTTPLRRQPCNLLGGALLVETGGQRISAEPQEVAARERRDTFAVSAQTRERDRGVFGRQAPEGLLLSGEGLLPPEKLQPAELAILECDRQRKRNAESKPETGGAQRISVGEWGN